MNAKDIGYGVHTYLRFLYGPYALAGDACTDAGGEACRSRYRRSGDRMFVRHL